jgi:hypothetical protein
VCPFTRETTLINSIHRTIPKLLKNRQNLNKLIRRRGNQWKKYTSGHQLDFRKPGFCSHPIPEDDEL